MIKAGSRDTKIQPATRSESPITRSNILPATHRSMLLSQIARVTLWVVILSASWLVTCTDLTAQTKVGKSGLQLPRYVSLKSDKVNLRTGPGVDYPTTWVYRRAGLPLEVFEEFQNWRHVRDSEGTEGWIFSSLLSGRRTALVLPWERANKDTKPTTTVYQASSERARKVAIIEAGVIADVHNCDGRWCEVTIDTFDGYIDQTKLWGVYPNESWK